ncbi:hypothetical protein Tco_0342331, partial [Tanacetum coccineum]
MTQPDATLDRRWPPPLTTVDRCSDDGPRYEVAEVVVRLGSLGTRLSDNDWWLLGSVRGSVFENSRR